MNYDSDSTMPAPPLQEEAVYVPYLEKDYCSNFVCCGVPLADLHELVGHFEENHVNVVSPEGVPSASESDSPVDVSSPQTASSLESPRSAFSNTPPPPNLFPTLTSAFRPRESAFPSVTTPSSREPWTDEHAYNHNAQHLPKEEQYVFDSMMHNEAYDCNNASSGIQIPINLFPHLQHCLQPAAQGSVIPHNPPSIAPRFTTHYDQQVNQTPAYSHPPTLAPTPVYARPPTLSIITDQHAQEEELTPSKRRRTETRSWGSTNESEELLPGRRRRVQKQPVREKAYKCPNEGCIKSYMNQNGLKYHLTKGVCDYDTTRAN